jgi:uncharacterized protein (UPF0332 family)
MKIEISPESIIRQFEIFISKANENLGAAKLLLGRRYFNKTVSIAYYSFFEAARAALVTQKLTAKTHSGILTLFDISFVKKRKIPARLSKFFHMVKNAREEADYEIFKKFTKEEAEEIVKMAEEFVSYIAKNFRKRASKH